MLIYLDIGPSQIAKRVQAADCDKSILRSFALSCDALALFLSCTLARCCCCCRVANRSKIALIYQLST